MDIEELWISLGGEKKSSISWENFAARLKTRTFKVIRFIERVFFMQTSLEQPG